MDTKKRNMKRIVKLLAIFAPFILAHISCTEEWLKPEPLSFYAPENIYINKAGFKSGLVTIRKDLKSDFYGSMNPLNGEVDASELACMWVNDWFEVTPSTGTYLPYLELFERIYGYIKNTNVVISRIDNIKWDNEDERNAILAEAYFYRSWWYYRLVHSYGDVPFLGQELTGAKLDFYTHSKWAILKKIQTDLEYASQWLPANPAIPGSPSKYAAYHLLAKVYLVNTDFDKAIEAASNIINGPFALMTQRFGSYAGKTSRNVIWDLHRPENKSLPQNTEAIFVCVDRAEAPTGAKTSGTYSMRNFHPEWWNAGMVRDSRGMRGTRDRLPDGKTNDPQYDTLGRGNPNVMMAPYHSYEIWAEKGYSWKTTPDLRRADINWVDNHEFLYNNPESVDFGKPINPQNYATPSDSVSSLFPIAFYKSWVPHEKTYTGHPMGGNGDWYVFRLAETYLIRAEAYYWKGQLSNAANDINIVRQRAHAVPVNPEEVTIDYIFDERARELFIEEMRHTELVRVAYIMAKMNRGGYSLANFSEKNWFYDRVMAKNIFYTIATIGTYTFYMAPYHALWPISINVITANTLGHINQNAGYEGAQTNIPPLETIE
jgi:hypothetical protein